MSIPSSPRRSRIAHFKAPFILSIAGPAALALACGGKTDADKHVSSNPPPQTDLKEVTQQQPPPLLKECDGDPPNNDANACGPYWQCVDGEWRSGPSGCNPPPPQSTICPESPAEVGTSCWGYLGELRCEYGDCPDVLRRCNASTRLWESMPAASCNPPEVCEATLPVAGSDCTVPDVSCSYPGACEGPSTATCRSGQWLVVLSSGPACNPPPVDLVCPERELVSGESCAYEGQECGREVCTPDEVNGHLCSGGVWQDTVLACPISNGVPDGGVPDGGS